MKVSQETTLGSFPVGFELFKCNFLAADAKKIDPHYRHCPIGLGWVQTWPDTGVFLKTRSRLVGVSVDRDLPRAIFGGSKADLLSPNSKRNCNIKIGR